MSVGPPRFPALRSWPCDPTLRTSRAKGVDCGAFKMPLRIRNYVDNFHMEQWRGKKFLSTSRLPPVLPIVIYSGDSPWSAAPRVIDLGTPGATGNERGSSNAASRADPLFAGDG